MLVVCAETTFASFQTPSASHVDGLIGHALFGDGAAAMIIGTNPNPSTEHPIFDLVLASQTTIPDTQNAIRGHSHDMGLVYYLDKEIPNIISSNVKKCLIDELGSAGFVDSIDLNKFFYAIHPGGPVVLSKVEEELGLSKEKLWASWHVLRHYGNMWSTTVIFVLDEVRKRSKAEGKTTTGEGLEWGVLLGFGPGLAVETVVLRSVYLEE